jgi:hypothetical protein
MTKPIPQAYAVPVSGTAADGPYVTAEPESYQQQTQAPQVTTQQPRGPHPGDFVVVVAQDQPGNYPARQPSDWCCLSWVSFIFCCWPVVSNSTTTFTIG